jgi:hypothetical protein
MKLVDITVLKLILGHHPSPKEATWHHIGSHWLKYNLVNKQLDAGENCIMRNFIIYTL